MRKKAKPLTPKRQKSIALFPVEPKISGSFNHLYFGDCIDVLKELSTREPFIDLIYIDPPFNSKRNYNVLFEHIDFKDTNAQKQAFADTWSNVVYIVELQNLANLNKDLYEFLDTLNKLKSISDSAVAYLTTMAHRIYYMQKLLKKTGSFYLHCDPNMSHYLKIICDMIFGEENFRNEIIWKRSLPHGNVTISFGRSHDCILFYTLSDKAIWNKQFNKHREEYVEQFYKYKDGDGRIYRLVSLINPNPDRPNLTYEWKGVKRVWKWTKDRMTKADEDGILVYSKNGVPSYKNYLQDMKGTPMQDIWDDIPPLMGGSEERLGYPTQKPEALMERIIKASTNDGDLVADFFCGCGTTISSAQKLKRQWLGSDISHLAIKLVQQRLIKAHGIKVIEQIKLHGFPRDVDSAKMLARDTENGRFGFQEWAIEVLLHGVVNQKRVADGGYDGYLTYQTDSGKNFVLIETKSGGVTVKNIREFIQVVDKQKAAAGIFVCFQETATREMLKEAKFAGKISLGKMKTDIDKIQIITIDDLLNGRQPHLPNVVTTFKQSQRVQPDIQTGKLF